MMHWTLPPITGRNPYEKAVRLQLLRLMYDNLYSSAFVIFFNASLFVYILWPAVPHTELSIWYGTLSLITLLRFLDTRRFFKQQNHPYDYWYRRLFTGVLLSAILWGAVPLLFFPAGEPEYQMFIIVIIVGMSAGALSTLAADLRLSYIYLFGLLLPLAYRLIEVGSTIYLAAAVLLITFIGIVTLATRQFHLNLVVNYKNLELYRKAKERLGSSEKRLRMMFDQAPIGIFYYDTDLVIVDANRALCHTLQVKPNQLIGLSLKEIPDQRPLQGAYHDNDFTKPGIYEGPYHTKFRDLDLWIKVEFMPIVDDHGNMLGGMAMLADSTKEHDAMEQAEFLSLHDPLTMLPNRKLLKERIRQLLKEEKRNARFSALLFLDLDRFKEINDAAGHLVGDRLLVDTAKRLKHLLRESDTLSRLGGDEFVILLPMLSTDEDGTIRHAFHVAEKIHSSLRRPFSIEGHVLYTSCSIGITTLESTTEDIDEVLRRADTAMYQSKEEGRDRTRFYDPDMDQKARKYLGIQQQLRHAVETGGFSLSYQPIVRIETNTVVAAESLLRWQDENGQEIPPSLFVPVAEDSGMIKAIGRWVINEACRQLSTWKQNKGFSLEYISVNISPRQLIESDFADYLIDTLRQHDIAPSLLRLEITETALIQNFEKTKGLIERLNAEGIKFIIDDFGTGYSSLSYLKQLSFSALKIDKSFVRDILEDPKDAALVRSIINIARQFGYPVIAEGVESEEQRVKLMQTDYTIYYQGFLCSEAKDTAAFEPYIANGRCHR
ncbi:MAG: EAL domain-containing protein [Campylobacterales bacterium]